MNLWLIALQNAVTIDAVNGQPGLAELFPLALSLLRNNIDQLVKIISIVESYILLDAPRLMQASTTNMSLVKKLAHWICRRTVTTSSQLLPWV